MLEVCSTTLPQRVLPMVMRDERYFPSLLERINSYKEKADMVHEIFTGIRGLTLHKPKGAFYFTVVFDEGTLTNKQTLMIENASVKALVESLVEHESSLDKRLVYYILGATGICVVPLTTGFNSSYFGFRATVLEPDIEIFKKVMTQLADSVRAYINS